MEVGAALGDGGVDDSLLIAGGAAAVGAGSAGTRVGLVGREL
jgi:hypothetical protein